MNNQTIIEIPITPVPASRPRVTRFSTYYGKKHTQYIKDVQGILLAIQKPQKPSDELVMLNTTYCLPLPKSMSKKKRLEKDSQFCEKNIDLDNLDKLFWDSVLTGTFIKDDCQIVMNTNKKIWTAEPVGYTLCVLEFIDKE